jgi:peptidoglycan/xylan/chitin deacetylase (PgdA/CDA1 family)
VKLSLYSCVLLLSFITTAFAQTPWNNKRAAIVLTYDDGIDGHLDMVVPALDTFGLKGTFYLIAGSQIIPKRFREWQAAAANGHELGNHSLKHPCTGGPGREFITAETDLRNYTVNRAEREIRLANSMLKNIDEKDRRTFAYPCGDMTIRDTVFYEGLKNEFVAARGVKSEMNTTGRVNLEDINAYFINGHSGKYMTDLVDKAVESKSLLVFLFHGVGGGHPFNVGLPEHRVLLQYLRDHEKDVWVCTMVDAATWVRSRQR